MTGIEGLKGTKLAGTLIAALMVVSALGVVATAYATGPAATGATPLPGVTSGPVPSGSQVPSLPTAAPQAVSSLPAAPLGPAVVVPASATSVGDGNDWYADAPSGDFIGVVTGTFPAESGITSEVSANGPGGGPNCAVGTSNCYGLQINTNQFPTTYASSGGPINTTGSEQFVYQDAGTSAFMGIWEILFGFTTCPSPSPSGFSSWDLDLGNCYAHTPFVSTPPVPVTDLANVTMTAYANESGNDALVFCVSPAISGWPVCTATSGADAIGLSEAWTVAEFNVFGDNGGSQAAFNGGAALQVQTQIATEGGGALVPSCAGAPGVHTVENNNLYLWPCSASSSGILFWEANESFGLSATSSSATVQAGQPASYSVGFTSFSGVPAPVQLTVLSPLPPGVTASFPATVTPPATAVLTLTTSPATPLGDYALTVQSQIAGLLGDPSPGPIATTTVSLHVFNFTVSISPGSQTIVRGLSATYAVQLSLDPGSTVVGVPPIVLADPGLPADASASAFNPAGYVLSSPTPTVLPFVVSTAPPPTGSLGDFPFSITGTPQGYPAGVESASAALHLFDFTVSLSPSTLKLAQGASTTMTVNVGLVSGSSTVGLPSVALSLTGVPGGLSTSGLPSTVGIPSTSSFSLGTAGSGGYVSCPQVTSSWGQNLRNANLAHCMLAGASLRGDNLQGANLTDADLANASLAWANLRGADLAGANTAGANFFAANLAGADLSGVGALGTFTLTVTGTTETVARVGTASVTVLGDQLSGDDLQFTNLYGANLTADQLVGANLQVSNLWGVIAPGANFSGANLQWSNLQGINAPGANFSAANLTTDNLAFADLAGADLAYADLAWDNLPYADLAGANLAYADLALANLPSADLAGASLPHADLRWANLPYADLKGANLEDADLERANLHDADLAGANLTGANLTGANLSGANLTGTTFKHANSERSAHKETKRSATHAAVDVRSPTSPLVPASSRGGASAGGGRYLLPSAGSSWIAATLAVLLGGLAVALLLSGGLRGRRPRDPRVGTGG